MAQNKSDKAVLPEDQVRLRPILGIGPGVYLAFLYTAILLAVLFFVLLYPGIANPGSVLVVNSEPQGAALLLDGAYIEATPCRVFAPQGRRQIELKLPGFQPMKLEKEVGGRLFASRIFPAKIEIREKLEVLSPGKAFIEYAEEYAAWTFTGEPSEVYQIPLTLSEGAYRLGPGAADPEVRKSMENTIIQAASFASTRAGLRDLIRAKTLLDNQGLSPSPLSLLGSAEDILAFLDENHQTALWLAAALSGESQAVVTSSSWYAEAAAPAAEERSYMAGQSGAIRAGLLNFRMISGGQNLLGKNFPAGTKVETFYISETLISASAWERFLENQPRWKKENTDALIEEGLVKSNYLEAVPSAPARGVAGISWYAADAFCQWLNQSFQSSSLGTLRELPPMEVRLPTEAEWEYAVKAGFVDSGYYWEWCEDCFAHLGFLPASSFNSPERSLRGGSWVNSPRLTGPETRASLPPSFCSPFVSFRPVIAPKRKQP